MTYGGSAKQSALDILRAMRGSSAPSRLKSYGHLRAALSGAAAFEVVQYLLAQPDRERRDLNKLDHR